MAAIKHEFCLNPALESSRAEACWAILLLLVLGQEGSRSVLGWVLLPKFEARRLWGQALLLRSAGAQRLKAACVCPRHRLNSSLLF